MGTESKTEHKYQNPPIVEAVCQFSFLPEAQWDMTVPGVYYERVKTDYPLKENRLLVSDQKKNNPDESMTQETSVTSLAAFLAPDSKTFVHIGENHLSIHRTKPYQSWTQYKPAIQKNFLVLTEIIPNIRIARIGLRYINRIEVSLVNIDLEEYLEFRPFLGEKLPKTLSGFAVGCVFDYPETDRCRVQLSARPAGLSENKAFILDLDYFTKKPDSISPEGAMDWVEKAHTQVESLFEGCITDRVRELLGEVRS